MIIGNDEALKKFVLNLEHKGKSKSCKDSYKNLVKRLLKDLDKDLKEISSEDIKMWLEEKYQKPESQRTNKYALSSFFKFCVEMGYLDISPINVSYRKFSKTEIDDETNNIIEEFLTKKKFHGSTEKTISSYEWVIKNFFTLSKKKLDEVTYNDILSWLENYNADKKKSTISQRIIILSIFFKYCLGEEYIEKLPIKKRWRPKVPESIPKYLHKFDYAKVKDKIEGLPLKERAIIETLDDTGIRCEELRKLNVGDINLNDRTAVVRGKGNKTRIVDFSEKLAFILKMMLTESPRSADSPLFLTNRGTRYKWNKSIYYLTDKLGKSAGINRHLSPHVFRHTAATRMVTKGADLSFVADEFGHSDEKTTQIYARIPSEELTKLYDKFMG